MKLKIQGYNSWHDINQELIMPKRNMPLKKEMESFGERLARLRHTAGFSQRELAAEIGISYRMVAYYETETVHPPTHLLPLLAKALGVSSDQLLGIEPIKEQGKAKDSRLWRRFAQVEKLTPAQRKPIIQVLDAFLKNST